MDRGKYSEVQQNSNTDVLLQAFENTDISVFMYYPQEKKIKVPQNVCKKYHCFEEYDNMPYSLRDQFVLADDYPAFMESYRKIDQGEKSATAQFHSKDLSLCWRVTLTVLNWQKHQPAKEVLGVIEDISEWDKDKQLIRQIQSQLDQADLEDPELKEARRQLYEVIGNQYNALYYVCLENHSFSYCKEMNRGILSAIGTEGSYEDAWEIFLKKYVVTEDQAAMRKFIEIDTLPERLSETNTITHVYRRKDEGWTRAQFIAAKRDMSGSVTRVIYTAVNINAEKNMELAQCKAEYEAQHDPLTGVLNRKGFEQMSELLSHQTTPIGFAMVDIDNFKMINDVFGHEAGDQILEQVAKMLSDAFRIEDSVFRLGGDEFAVLLQNCTHTAWNTLCEKQHRIHAALEAQFRDRAVTLSIGICFSGNGYNGEQYRLADEMLYET